MLSRLRSQLQRFQRSTSGIAAVEFALIVPVILILTLSGFETMRAIAASTRATYLSTSLAELLSQTTTTLSAAEASRIIESAPLIDPDILDYARQSSRLDPWGVAQVTLSSVQFSKTVATCVTNCAYRGDTVFSYAANGAVRPCGEVLPGSGATQLPPDVFGPGSVVVVDIKVPYKPVTNVLFSTEFTFKRTAYFRPRYVSTINYVTNCTGF